jgi:superfamily II DNA or RNA helicase/HKD family nuclease/diadenosine tetraphosphate (Ap4A) HIT family hydrolase
MRCPFCEPEPTRIAFQKEKCYALWDSFPVSIGHLLLIPYRHVASWFEATPEEQLELFQSIEQAKEIITAKHQPDGFNVGINIGAAAGQTVPHLHVHVIPRYQGDVADPRGGVRYVIPDKANYLKDEPVIVDDNLLRISHQHTGRSNRISKIIRPESIGDAALVRGAPSPQQHDPLLPHLCAGLESSQSADLSVAFIQRSGVELLRPYLNDLLAKGGRLRILTGDYLSVTDPDSLLELLDLEGDIQVRVFEAREKSFHPKAYLFHYPDGSGIVFVGSSNLTRTALHSGIEWNYRVVKTSDQSGFQAVQMAFNDLWSHPSTCRVDTDWVEDYRKRRVATTITREQISEETQLIPPPEPNRIQQRALEALAKTRIAGNRSGLVVLATGLGKTWLAAFDSVDPAFRRILFVAHRDEILQQAIHTFRRIRPTSRIGRYAGVEKDLSADIVFASIQTIGKTQHLQNFSPASFDYIVVDEFHHASAPTYRRLIQHFEPKFMLGLTATPQRSDGGDLLSLCDGNLVYRCDLADGIQNDLLAPFRYFGVPDEVDYTNIPWRSSRFDEEALTLAIATQSRARHTLEMFRKYKAKRAIGFCCSTRHADFMAEYFREQGLSAVAVHSGPLTAPRASSLEKLGNGELDIIFSVDMFNEGLDLPSIDTILMLRPTESTIVWLQQFGRGLRKSPDKEYVRVIDYIGNHRSFLVKVRSLLEPICGLLSTDSSIRDVLTKLQEQALELPAGCEINYDLQAIDTIQSMLRSRQAYEAIDVWMDDFCEQHGRRATAVEAFNAGFNPRALHSTHGSWFSYLVTRDDASPERQWLSKDERQAIERYSALLRDWSKTQMTKSYKMLVLSSMLQTKSLHKGVGLMTLVEHFRRLANRSAAIREDLGESLQDDKRLGRMIRDNPIKAWTSEKGSLSTTYFEMKDGNFALNQTIDKGLQAHFDELIDELVQWRLADYFQRDDRVERLGGIRCRVIQSGGRPILKLPDRDKNPGLPIGWQSVEAKGELYKAKFAKEFINVIKRSEDESEDNELPELLRSFFGPLAGQPGTRFTVMLIPSSTGVWSLTDLSEQVDES